ncbi:MAG: hypothetical protein IPK19_33945 [Chloroflexi bacterium]|nr:hypothetical protein [Chloroflexota bacterium]
MTVLLVTTITVTGILAFALVAGAANPPVAPRQIYNADSLPQFSAPDREGLRWVALTTTGIKPPFTLQTEATFSEAGRFWGFWLEGTDYAKPLKFVIHPEGSYSLSNAALPDWHPFIHIRSERNRLYLHVELDGSATLRLNEELVTRFGAGTSETWQAGIVFDSSLPPVWHSIRLHGS